MPQRPTPKAPIQATQQVKAGVAVKVSATQLVPIGHLANHKELTGVLIDPIQPAMAATNLMATRMAAAQAAVVVMPVTKVGQTQTARIGAPQPGKTGVNQLAARCLVVKPMAKTG